MAIRQYPYRKSIIRYLFKSLDFILDLFINKKKTLPNIFDNILLIKPDHLGDIVLFTSIIEPIKKKYPNSNVDVVIGSWSNQLIKNNINIRNIYNVDHYKHNRAVNSTFSKIKIFFTTYINTLKTIREIKYNLVLNFRSYGMNLVTLQYLSNSKYTIGFASSGFSPLLDLEVELIDNQHEVEYFIDILKEINIKIEMKDLSSKLYISKEDNSYVDNILKQYNLDKFIIIHPGSGDMNRLMTDEFWSDIISKQGMKIVFCGTKSEMNLIDNISCSNTINLMGKFNILQLLDFYKKAQLIYAVESLAGHIASITDVKTISFYSNFTDTTRWKPIGINVKVIKEHAKYLESLI
jgi:heptosyltransferase III